MVQGIIEALPVATEGENNLDTSSRACSGRELEKYSVRIIQGADIGKMARGLMA
jgi:hypothetical protein